MSDPVVIPRFDVDVTVTESTPDIQIIYPKGDKGDVGPRGASSLDPVSGTLTRENGLIMVVALADGRTWTFTRDAEGRIATINNGRDLITYSRDEAGKIISWAVTEAPGIE